MGWIGKCWAQFAKHQSVCVLVLGGQSVCLHNRDQDGKQKASVVAQIIQNEITKAQFTSHAFH